MRKTLLLFMLLCVKLTYGQLADDFSDGNFTAKPLWQGQQNAFLVNQLKQLQTKLSANAQSVSLVSANALALNVKWEFKVQMNFDPSSSNQARIYLIADQKELNGPLNGYFIQIGESGSADSYDLYRQNGNNITKLIDGLPKTRANVNALLATVKVSRDEQGNWALYTAINGGKNFSLEGKASDLSFTLSQWFGLSCKYTATRSDGFIFDDFLIEELQPDLTAPTLLACKAIDEWTVEATFSEGLELLSALNTNHYSLSKLGNPKAIVATNLPSVYRLTFAEPLTSGDYTLTVHQLKDLKGNELLENNRASFFYIKPYLAKKGDVIINEIFADPLPSQGLPSVEFVELWNTSNEYISLNDWKYGDLTSTHTFDATTILAPNSYLILTAKPDMALFKAYGQTIGLPTWPGLNNEEDKLSLLDAHGALIDEVAYTVDWYQDEMKKGGGFSLELIDPQNQCKGIQNWLASRAIAGGTPGRQNSVYQSQLHTLRPQLLQASIIDDTSIMLTFNKYVNVQSASKTTNYSLNNGIGFPLAAIPQGPAFTNVLLKLAQPLPVGIAHVLTLNDISDCAGNLIDPKMNTAKLFKAKAISKGDILISEILVNPKNGGVDFVEIYNQSNHVLDLKELKLGNADRSEALSTQSVYMPAKTHWVLTSDPANIQQHYRVEFHNQFVKMSNFPTYNNEKGRVLLSTGAQVIDQLDYNESMHFPLLRKVDGVALERVSYQKATAEPGNFRSAAASVGFATPTYRNSQEEDPNQLKNKLVLASKTFSPDGDGFEDLLQADYQLASNGNLANVNIYTDRGVLVKRLQKNSTIATSGTLTWDGIDDNGKQSKVGIYVLSFDAFNLNGKKVHFKETFVLAAKLN